MSALFPNVPNLPGVPSVARASASLQTMLSQSNVAEAAGRQALSFLTAGNTGGASSALATAAASAGGAFDLGGPIFSGGSDVMGALTGTIANANGGIANIAGGAIGQALSSIERTIGNASGAVAAITQALLPSPLRALFGSGFAAQADAATQWGLYTSGGSLAVEPDNVVAFENHLEARISTYPVEKGSFGSYNKVEVPFDILLIMSKGGSVEARQDFLKSCQKVWQATDLYSVITPTCVYLDMNVVSLRTAAASDRGATLMTIELGLQKVRQTATLSFTSTKEPTGSGTVNNGSVQTKPPPIDSSLEGAPR